MKKENKMSTTPIKQSDEKAETRERIVLEKNILKSPAALFSVHQYTYGLNNYRGFSLFNDGKYFKNSFYGKALFLLADYYSFMTNIKFPQSDKDLSSMLRGIFNEKSFSKAYKSMTNYSNVNSHVWHRFVVLLSLCVSLGRSNNDKGYFIQ